MSSASLRACRSASDSSSSQTKSPDFCGVEDRSRGDGRTTVGAAVGRLLVVLVVVVVLVVLVGDDDLGGGELGLQLDVDDLLEVGDLGRALELDLGALEVGRLAVRDGAGGVGRAGGDAVRGRARPRDLPVAFARDRVLDAGAGLVAVLADGSLRGAESAAATRPSRYGALLRCAGAGNDSSGCRW